MGGMACACLNPGLPSSLVLIIIIVLFFPRLGRHAYTYVPAHTPWPRSSLQAGAGTQSVVWCGRQWIARRFAPQPLVFAAPAVLPQSMHPIGVRFACDCFVVLLLLEAQFCAG